MKNFAFKKIDAFATEKSEGNPAGAIFLTTAHEISTHEMQRIARELKGFVSEVGYVRQLDENTFALKYYSSEREVEFCGHATIAIMYDLLKNNPELLDKQSLTIVTDKGALAVENRIKNEDAVFITAPNPIFISREIAKQELSDALKMAPDFMDSAYPISIVDAGLETLLVPIENLQAVLSLSPHVGELKNFCLKHSIDIITVFTDDVADASNAYRTRVFAPTFGYLEDPATGSGNAAFGCYLSNLEKWDGRCISIEQNGSFEKPNIVKLLAQYDENNNARVRFGGGAIVRIQGEYFLS